MEKCIGEITHYFNRLGVAVLSLNESLSVGEMIHILGHTTDFFQEALSMEVNHHKVQTVGPGAPVALKVDEPVRAGDWLYRVEEEDTQPFT